MTKPSKPTPSDFIPYSDGDLALPYPHEVDEYPVQSDGISVFEKSNTDHRINAELKLTQYEMRKVKVFSQSKDDNGHIIGKYDINPVLNTMIYDFEFSDGFIHKYVVPS